MSKHWSATPIRKVSEPELYPVKPLDDKVVSAWTLEYLNMPTLDERTQRIGSDNA